MKTKLITISMVAMLALAAVAMAQNPDAVRAAGTDLLAAMKGDMVRFERGMRSLDQVLSKNPNNLEAKVLHGNGVMARAGEAFKTGDIANATKLWQSGLDEMAQAVDAAPDNVFVRARRGVFMITASRNTPTEMSKPLLEKLEQKLDPALFLRIHRATLLNLNYVDEVSSWFGGGMVVRLKDGKRTELQISRDRLREVKDRLEF